MRRASLFQRIEKKSITNEIIDQILAIVRTGSVEPGNRLPSELELMEQFGVGRSSVREALKALEVLGVVSRANGGTVVSSSQNPATDTQFLTADLATKRLQVAEVYQARRILEVELGVLALKHADPNDIASLRSLVAEMAQFGAEEIADYARIDREFHRCISALAGNQVLARMWEIAYDLFLEIRLSVPVSSAFLDASNRRHELLVGAIESADPEQLRATMMDSLRLGELDLEMQLVPKVLGL